MGVTLQNEVLYFNMDHPIGRWRARHHVSQEELGRRCQLSQKAISAYESGTRIPRGDSLRRLQAETGLPLEALIFPQAFLRDHPDFLMEPPRQRKRRRETPPEEGEEGHL
jgi:transcriptional regulator with XRE-family HTH domain